MPLGGLFDLERMEMDIKEDAETMAQPEFWDDPQTAQTFINEANELKNKYDTFMKLSDGIEEYQLMLEMIEETHDEELMLEITNGIEELDAEIEDFELLMLLSGPYDLNNAILELHPGAGGT